MQLLKSETPGNVAFILVPFYDLKNRSRDGNQTICNAYFLTV